MDALVEQQEEIRTGRCPSLQAAPNEAKHQTRTNPAQSATDKPQSMFAMLLPPNNLHSSRANCSLLPPRQFGMHLFINNIHY
jgi:hypothetical protein